MSKTICIYHSIDLDGWMSAAIVKKWFEDNNDIISSSIKDVKDRFNHPNPYIVAGYNYLDMLGWNYGNPIPDVSSYDRVIMCDVSFPVESMIKISNESDFIWIDHHKSAINTIENHIEDLDGYRDTNFAACELTWKHFYPTKHMPEIVRLLGRYDCFGHKGTDEELKVLQFQYGARQCITNYQEAYNHLVDEANDYNKNPTTVEVIQANGVSIYSYLRTEAKTIYNTGKSITFSGLEIGRGKTAIPKSVEFIAINRLRFNPVNFGIDYHADGFDGVMCYAYDENKWTASLYNDNGKVDCSVIARNFGGGGHKGAAGFIGDTNKFAKILNWE